MQVARLLEPKKRTLSSKIIEALRALQLEAQLSKSEILDLYLTYAPFGANIEGLEAASYRYFKKPSKFLAPGELAFLLLLPQSPHRWDRKSVSSLETKRAQVLDRLLACDVISAEDRDQALTSPIPEWRSSFESHAEHLSDLVPAKQPSNTSFNIQTTLDYQIQSSIEDLIHHSEASLRAKGILNVSVLVLDNPSGELRAAIGNFDFYRSSDNQKMTGFNTFRSTGSLLKPFIFARLIEAGQMLPATLLEDVPIDVEGYEPKNYDGQFSGLVEAQLALSNSLNVPWVKQLRDHGIDGFLTFLLNSGMRSSLTRDKLGLSIAIGGLETTQWDLLMLYRALARDGKIKPIRWLRNEPSRDEWQWLHPGAVELTRDALAIRGRPDFAIDPSYLKQSDIRWKTGTSQGNRDAWAIGFTARYTIAVWLGNLDYAPAPALVGPEVSAPILFDAFSRIRNIDKEPLHQWNHRHTEQVEVCIFWSPRWSALSSSQTHYGRERTPSS
jgi:penicillin-binding protein 1C